MLPNGSKEFSIKLSELKLFIQPYFFMMIDHFFRDGLPQYDMESFDKPNEYDNNIEKYPELNVTLSFREALLCFASDTDRIHKTIACRSNMEYEFKREKIK